jgi:hypothetical protein
VGWLLAVALVFNTWAGPELAGASPIVGITFPTLAMRFYAKDEWDWLIKTWFLWIAIYGFIALGLGLAALRSFDGCLGRGAQR